MTARLCCLLKFDLSVFSSSLSWGVLVLLWHVCCPRTLCSTISMALATILANLVHQWSCELVDERAHVCQHLQQVVEVGSWAVAVIVSEDGN